MIDPQELEAAAKDVRDRTGHQDVRVSFNVRIGHLPHTYFVVAAGGPLNPDEIIEVGDALGVTVEACIATALHSQKSEVQRLEERLRVLKSQAA